MSSRRQIIAEGVELELDEPIVKTTDMAILISVGGVEHWLPRSQVHADNETDAELIEEGDHDNILVRTWWAEKVGLE